MDTQQMYNTKVLETHTMQDLRTVLVTRQYGYTKEMNFNTTRNTFYVVKRDSMDTKQQRY